MCVNAHYLPDDQAIDDLKEARLTTIKPGFHRSFMKPPLLASKGFKTIRLCWFSRPQSKYKNRLFDPKQPVFCVPLRITVMDCGETSIDLLSRLSHL